MRIPIIICLLGALIGGETPPPETEIKPILAKSVIEAVEFTSRHLDPQLRTEIVALNNPDDMIIFHHGLGTWVRNHCGLWQPDSPLLAGLREKSFTFDGHPDSASHIVLGALWAYERGRAAAAPPPAGATTTPVPVAPAP
jgi:hypothetical protein